MNYLKEMKDMKKMLAVAAILTVSALFLTKKAMADGNYSPALVVSSVSNQGYLYPTTASPAGGVLVSNGGGVFNWGAGVISATNSLTSQAFPAFPSLTLTQLAALQTPTTGQMAWCRAE